MGEASRVRVTYTEPALIDVAVARRTGWEGFATHEGARPFSGHYSYDEWVTIREALGLLVRSRGADSDMAASLITRVTQHLRYLDRDAGSDE